MFEARKLPPQLKGKDDRDNEPARHPALSDSPTMVSQRKRLDKAFGTQLQSKSKTPLRMPTSSATPVVQAVTKIKHTAGIVKLGTLGNPTVGKKMEAQLDVADPVMGTATGAQWQWTRALRQKFPQAGVVRGHLLNHDLGGNAIPSNLYPISTKANSEHSSKVEQPVKKLLNEAEADVRSSHGGSLVTNDANHYVHYEVNVGETTADDPQKASFNCAFKVGPTGAVTNVSVPSNLGTDKDRYSASAGLIPGLAKIPAHAQWAHTGKWTPTSTLDPKIERNLGLHSDAIPTLAKGGQPDYSTAYEAVRFRYNDRIRDIEHGTRFAYYSPEQDKVRKFILSLPAFRDDLEDFVASDNPDARLAQFLLDLEEAVEAASKIIPPTALPKKYWTARFKKAKAKVASKPVTNHIYEAVKALSPKVPYKDIKKYVEANHKIDLTILSMKKALEELESVGLVKGHGAVKTSSWSVTSLSRYV